MGSNPTSSAKTIKRRDNGLLPDRPDSLTERPGANMPVVSLASIMVARGSQTTARSIDAAVGRVASAQHGVFSRAQALRSGATDGLIAYRLASGRWTRVHQGVYGIAGVPASWRKRLMAVCLAAGGGAVASHRSAARLWHLPGVIPEPVPEITVLKGRAPRRSDLIAHETRRLPVADTTKVDGIPVTSVARTLIDCAAVWQPTILEEALDDALRRGLVSLPRLRWRMREIGGSGRAGTNALRRLVDARRVGDPVPGSALERRVLRLLVRARLPAPRRQHQIRDAGRLLAVVDFAYPDARLAIEADGYRYHSGRVRWQRDLTRRNALTSRGWRVIHVTAEDLATRSDEVVRAVRRALKKSDSRVH